MGFAGCVVVLVACVGCVDSNAVQCPNGMTCPDGTRCAVVAIAGEDKSLCVQQSQLDACVNVGAGEACNGSPGTCHDGVCLPDVCGNSLLDATEVCDDGPSNGMAVRGGCTADCRSNQTCGNSIVDVLVGETCDTGDQLSHDGCASSCVTESPHWDAVEGRRPIARIDAALAYDAKRRRMILFGGSRPLIGQPDDLADMFAWDGLRWSTIPGEQPPPRSAHAMTFDSVRGELVLFSGGTNSADTWTWNGGWHLRQPELIGVVPQARKDGGFVFDSKRGVGVLFGGTRYDAYEEFGDTWEWNGTSWAKLTVTSPSPRQQFAIGYDAKRGVVVVFGGYKSFSTLHNELWEFDGTTWTQKTPSGGPSARARARFAFDPLSDRLMLVGGVNGAGVAQQDVWAWNGSAWAQLASAPANIGRPALATDPLRRRVVLLANDQELYEWNGTSWSPPVNAGSVAETQPSERAHASVALDPFRRHVLLFGGTNEQTFGTIPSNPAAYDDTWLFDGTWRKSGAVGPAGRYGAAIAYDEERKETIMFGGCFYDGGNATNEPISNETWVWTGSQWILRTPQNPPPPLCFATMAYDRARKEVVLFGGRETGSVLKKETWTWNGSVWTKKTPATVPPERFRAAMGADPIRERVILFGGQFADGTSYADTWIWNGQDWALGPTNGPPGRRASAMTWDAAREKLVLVGGEIFSYFQNDVFFDDAVWEWDGMSWTLQPVHGLGARSGHALAGSPDGMGVIALDGFVASQGTTPPVADLWRLRWDSTASSETCVDVDADDDQRAGCDDPDCWISCTPHCPPGTSCMPVLRVCGDNVCDTTLESCISCVIDCGACLAACGNFACESGESATTCAGDCP